MMSFLEEISPYLALFGFGGMGIYLIYHSLKYHFYSEETLAVITKIEDYLENFEESEVFRYLIFLEFETIDGVKVSGRLLRRSLRYNMWKGNKIQIIYLKYDPLQIELSIPNKWVGLFFGLGSILFGIYLFVEFCPIFQEDVIILN